MSATGEKKNEVKFDQPDISTGKMFSKSELHQPVPKQNTSMSATDEKKNEIKFGKPGFVLSNAEPLHQPIPIQNPLMSTTGEKKTKSSLANKLYQQVLFSPCQNDYTH
ncbi:hypothetical protein JTB14_037322 [Gonioctena quinquepunctata]|nr:hypothetical protein JTB14_037322 [Gonioctena quinquepunctata]